MLQEQKTKKYSDAIIESRAIRQSRAVAMRAKGHSVQEIADTMGCSVGTIWSDIKAALQDLANQRSELGELVLDDTIQSYQRIENIIVRRGQINLKYELRLAEIRLVKARETGGIVSGKTAQEWEAYIEYLLESDDETSGLSNEDLDRLITVRDKISKLLGVEPPKKLAVEHTFVMQAKDAQQRLRDKLGIPVLGQRIESPVLEGEIIEAAKSSEDETDLIGGGESLLP